MSQDQNQQELMNEQVRELTQQPSRFFWQIAREEIHARVTTLPRRLTAETLLLISAPLTVLVTLMLSTSFLTLASLPLHRFELIAATLIALTAGLVAVLPLHNSLRSNAQAEKLLRAALASIALRAGLFFVGAYLAMGPGYHLAQMPLFYWVLAFYFPTMITETATIACILRKLDNI
jgi:hypothetical protein